jgi:outer membrane protein OmpA-like peptidoglycan-associated protein
VESGNAAGKYKTTDWGYVMNLGVEKGKFGFQAFIENGLKSYYQQTGIKSIQHRVIGLSLNYFLSPLPEKVTTVIVKENEKDSDSDGIGDVKDACPFESGSQLTAGCPDTDGDGVADKTDKCPSTKGLAKYQGCPIPDTDQDGIDDEKDSCVNLKGVPNYNGCPPPVLTDTIRKKFESIAAKIFFEYKSDSLKPSSVIELEELSNILLQNPQLILKIEGHTDNAGNQASNLQLSQHRAESVKSYFIQKGIDPSRLNAIGWGQERPKASNETEEGRKLNRRVELLVEEKNQ